MVREKIVLENGAETVTTGNQRARLESLGGERVLLRLVQAGQIDTARHEHTPTDFSDCLKRALNSVENSLKDTYKTKHQIRLCNKDTPL